jgi:hemerythrin-like domain-containing protein
VAVNYHELIDDHDHIERLAAQLEHSVKNDPVDHASVDSVLGELATVVDDHLKKEDSFIYPQLAASADPADATSLIVEFEEIKRDWEIYLSSWKEGQAANDWNGFAASSIGMLERLRKRVMKETGLLYSMALREGLIDMKPQHRERL